MLEWERDYKVESHRRWQAQLGEAPFRALRTGAVIVRDVTPKAL